MKVTLIGPVYPYRGGISHYTAMLRRSLDAAGYVCQVISFRRQYPAWLYPGRTDKDPSRKPIQTNAEMSLDPLYPWTWLHARQQIEGFAPDLIVIQWWTTFWAPAFGVLSRLLRQTDRPVVYVIHNVLPHEQRFYDRQLARFALSGGNAYITQTSRERTRLEALLRGVKVYSCPLPAYHLLRDESMTPAEARRKLGLPENGFTLLFFGFIRPYKGVHVLLEALGRLRTDGKCPYLAVAGEFWHDKDAYLAEIERYGLAEQVRIEDRYIPDEEIGRWFQAADCLIAPYLAGTQSAAAGIALAYGLPMIASRTVAEGIAPEHRDALVEVVPPGDAPALAEAIARTMALPPESWQSKWRQAHDGVGGGDWEQLVQMLAGIAAEARS